MVIWITATGRWKGLGEKWKCSSYSEFEIRCFSQNERCGNWKWNKRRNKFKISLGLSIQPVAESVEETLTKITEKQGTYNRHLTGICSGFCLVRWWRRTVRVKELKIYNRRRKGNDKHCPLSDRQVKKPVVCSIDLYGWEVLLGIGVSLECCESSVSRSEDN